MLSLILRPVTIAPKKETKESVKKMISSNCPISMDNPAIPIVPSVKAIKANIKNDNAARIIIPPYIGIFLELDHLLNTQN
jgi:hypothetical protein